MTSMGNTYDSAAEADVDREQQRALLVALGAWDRALRRDDCGAWCIHGEKYHRHMPYGGSIHTWGDGRTWVLYVRCRSVLHWTWTKRRLSFCTVTQDGEDEGCLRLHQLPTPAQAEAIRDAVGIRKRREVSDEERERLKERLKAFAFERKPRSEATLEQKTGLGAPPLPNVPQNQTPIFGAESGEPTR